MGMQSFAHFVTLDNSFNFLSLSFPTVSKERCLL